jgi:ankyrin repeat protein
MTGAGMKRAVLGSMDDLKRAATEPGFWDVRTATGQGPLHIAAKDDGPEAWAKVAWMLGQGADPLALDHDRRTPLMLALEWKRDWAEWHPLIAASKRSVPWQDAAGRTALHRAVQSKAAGAVPFLLSAGADPMARDHQGIRPLDIARTIPDPQGPDAWLVRSITRAASDPSINWSPSPTVIRDRLRQAREGRQVRLSR